MDIQVRAVFDGYRAFGFDGLARRRNGDEFTIAEEKFDPSWMERVADDEAAPKKRGRKPKEETGE